MLKRFFAAFLIVAMTSTQASAVASSGLAQAFDEFNYALSVEWDQRDRGFHDAKVEELKGKLADFSNAEILEFALGKIKDKQLAEQFKTTYSSFEANRMDQSEVHDLIVSINSKSYARGSNWISGLAGGIIGSFPIWGLFLIACLGGFDGGSEDGRTCSEGFVYQDGEYYETFECTL